MYKYLVEHNVFKLGTANTYEMSVQNKNIFQQNMQGQRGLIDSASYRPLPHIHKGDWSPYKNNLFTASSKVNWGVREKEPELWL